MALVTKYSLAKEGNKQLTKNFKVREFRCKDGSDLILICQETVEILQAIRDYFGKQVVINSAYRTPSWNKKVGGASNSQHVKGTACDIRVKDVPSWAVAGFLEDRYTNHGIGYYSTFVHIDSRGYKSYWKDSGSNVKGSFFIGKNYESYKAKPVVIPVKPVESEEEVTQADFNKMYQTMITSLSKEKQSNWGTELNEAIAWAKQEGILKGDESGNLMMQKPLTRQEMVLMLYRESKR